MRHGAKTQGHRHGDVLALCALLIVLVLIAAPPRPAAAKVPAFRPWEASFVLDTDLGLAEQFGYAPPYTRNVPTFDSLDRPYIRSRASDANYTAFVHTLGAAGWERRGFLPAIRAAYPDFAGTVRGGGGAGDRIVFDRQDRAYSPLTIRLRDGSTRNVLLVSLDRCLTWSVVPLPAGQFVSETWTGHNELDGPPFLAFWSRSAVSTVLRGQRHFLWVTQPVIAGDEVIVPEPTLVTNESLGLNRASGGSSFAATVGGTTYFVWPEATPADDGGVPVMVAAFDHATGTVSPPVQLARIRPDDDTHVQPGICVDGRGYLHVVTGSHGGPFLYTRSAVPLRVDAGWTAPEPTLDDGYYVPSTDAQRGPTDLPLVRVRRGRRPPHRLSAVAPAVRPLSPARGVRGAVAPAQAVGTAVEPRRASSSSPPTPATASSTRSSASTTTVVSSSRSPTPAATSSSPRLTAPPATGSWRTGRSSWASTAAGCCSSPTTGAPSGASRPPTTSPPAWTPRGRCEAPDGTARAPRHRRDGGVLGGGAGRGR